MRSFVLFTILAISVFSPLHHLQAGETGYASSRHLSRAGYHAKGAWHFSHSPHVQNSDIKCCRSTRKASPQTYVVKRNTRRQPYYDGRGRLYYNTETIVTYKTVYPDGRYRLYCKTYPGY